MTTDPTDQELIVESRKYATIECPSQIARRFIFRLADRLEARSPQPDLEGPGEAFAEAYGLPQDEKLLWAMRCALNAQRKAPLAQPDLDDETLVAMCKAHDTEEAAQRGEPSPWDDYDPATDDNEFRMCRIVAMRCAVELLEGVSERRPIQESREGWKLVPVVPTGDMLAAGCRPDSDSIGGILKVYQAMLAASPTAPEAQAAPEPVSVEEIAFLIQEKLAACLLIDDDGEIAGKGPASFQAAQAILKHLEGRRG